MERVGTVSPASAEIALSLGKSMASGPLLQPLGALFQGPHGPPGPILGLDRPRRRSHIGGHGYQARIAPRVSELENRDFVDQNGHPALALLAARTGLFARQGSLCASSRRIGLNRPRIPRLPQARLEAFLDARDAQEGL
jgi:hypothetical protein